MRIYAIVYIFIGCLKAENAIICNICECNPNNGPSVNGTEVNCSFREKTLELNAILPNNAISLNLSQSNISKIQPTALLKSATVLVLLLNKNSLMDINIDSFQLPELKRLDLSDNELEILSPKLFEGITKLEYLNLADNKFTAVTQLKFNVLVNLKEIILDNNNIGADIETRSLFDTNGYGLSTDIQFISISGVNLKDLDEQYFKPVDNTLKKLTVSNNSLSKLLTLPHHLEYLDISRNPIKNITIDDFPWLVPLLYLRVLKLNYLEISELTKNVLGNLFLFHVELENNKNLKEFSNLTFGRQILRDTYDFYVENLTLKGSNLSTLDESLSGIFARVKRLDLQKNPWICDCRLAWLTKLKIAPDLLEDLRCASPLHHFNKRIFDLNQEDFICQSTSWWGATEIEITLGLIVYILLIFITLAWIYICVYQPAARVNKQEYSQLN